MKLRLHKFGLYIHWYKDWMSYALVISITTRNSSIQVGPLWVSLAYPDYDW